MRARDGCIDRLRYPRTVLVDRLRGLTNTLLAVAQQLSTARPFGEDMPKRPTGYCLRYDYLRFTTTLVRFLLPIRFRSAFHVVMGLTMPNRDCSDPTVQARKYELKFLLVSVMV
jgi:hypothetical protein